MCSFWKRPEGGRPGGGSEMVHLYREAYGGGVLGEAGYSRED